MPDVPDNELINLIRLTGKREADILSAKSSQNEVWGKIQATIDEHESYVRMAEHHTRQKALQDPVHGAVLLDPWELDIISSWEMLRLRYVRQLGPAHLVYPGATHTRFEHCIGTNFLAQKCIRVVNYCENLDEACFIPLSGLLDEYHQKLFRASALLHDVGHPPTSHTIEFALESWSGLSHTDLGEFLILNSALSNILERNDIDPKTVVAILKRRTSDPVLSLISDFIDSPLDIDKTDYLIRDAHFSGVQLGIFPAERVLMTNRVVKDSSGQYRRAFMLKALHSLEALILSRSWMFADLYYHHAVRVAEALTSKATYFRIKEEDFSKNECIGLFTRMTDGDLYRWLEQSEIDFVREYAARIRYRRLFKVVTSRSISSFEQDVQQRILSMHEDIEKLVEAELELIDTPGRIVIDVVNPELGAAFLSKIPILTGGEEGFDIVKLSKTEEGKPLMQLLKQQQRTIPSVRVYSDPAIANEVLKTFNKIFPSAEAPRYREDDYDLTDY
ncbi:MAG: HD domain-containing protein [Candidatus Thorarchaeota archaeon]